MKIILKKRSGKYLDVFDVSEDTTVEEFKMEFYKRYHYYPERQRWNIDSPTGSILKDDLNMLENGIYDGITMYFRDLGVQISWRLVFVLEYLGPIVIFPILFYCPSLIYGVDESQSRKSIVQTVGFTLAMIHFLKREFETLFIHRFSNQTMPIIRVPINCGHYWLLFGVLVGYYLFHPKYLSPWTGDNNLIIYILALAMLVFEYLNFQTHLILKNLRPRNTKHRGIPRGFGFDYVSCANYFWEIMAWITFSILVQTLTAWIFCIAASFIMIKWALKKHTNYRRQFSDYPSNRMAVIPFIL